MFREQFFAYETHFLVTVVFLLASLVIWVRISTVKDTYRYVLQEKELIRAQQEIQAVKLKWLKETSPRKLEAVARNLRLFPPSINQTLKYRSERIVAKK
jgi:hypothetical protein